jgi:hypothetical protein
MMQSMLLMTLFSSPATAAAPQLAEHFDAPPRFQLEDEREIPDEEILVIEQKLNIGPAATVDRLRNYDMEISLRGRSMSVPKSIMDIWFFNEEEEGWAIDGEPRPKLSGSAWGVEFVVKGASANGIFYLDYVDSAMDTGYWDDVEEPGDHLDGDYLVPSPNLGLFAFGADYGYEVHIVRTDMTAGYYGLSLLVGGGLGMGVMVGSVDRWAPDEDDGTPSFQLFNEGEDANAQKRIPRVYPIVDVNAGIRMNFANRVVMRFEGGLHTLVYFGGSVGYMF